LRLLPHSFPGPVRRRPFGLRACSAHGLLSILTQSVIRLTNVSTGLSLKPTAARMDQYEPIRRAGDVRVRRAWEGFQVPSTTCWQRLIVEVWEGSDGCPIIEQVAVQSGCSSVRP
jgi:hypothetical protein